MREVFRGPLAATRAFHKKIRLYVYITTTPFKYRLIFRMDITFNYDFIKTLKISCFVSVSIFKESDPRIEFAGHFGYYINYFKFETFIMPNEFFEDNFIGL